VARPAAAKTVFAANVRRLRGDSGWTQERLAERLGVDLRYLQRVEAGEVDVRLSFVERTARAFAVGYADLLVPARLPPPRRGRPRVTRRTASSSHR
jgi:transcriptional regulator with XRE-family HTH domain